MNNLLNIRTPAEEQASALKSDYGLISQGLSNQRIVYWNLPTEALYEEIIFRNEARVAYRGPIIVNTGKHTARAASDKFIVREPSTERYIWWGQYNRPFSSEMFDTLLARLQGFLQGRDLFVQDCYGGADVAFRSVGGSGIVVSPVTYIFEEEPPRYTAMLAALKGKP